MLGLKKCNTNNEKNQPNSNNEKNQPNSVFEKYFFEDFLKKENIIYSKHKNYYINVKIPIKYEYNTSNLDINRKGLFSISKIMAYVFVFDHNDKN